MKYLPSLLKPLSLAWLLCLAISLGTQAETREFSARLSPMPVDFRSAGRISGLGQLRAQLTGSRLELTGEFEGLSGAASVAHLHHGPLAMSGPAIAELQVTQAPAGKISATLDLSPEQLESLNQRGLYVQIHSQAAPDGNLRGWLFAVPK